MGLGFAALLFVEADLNWQYAWSFLSDTLPLVLIAVLLVGLTRGRSLWWSGACAGVLFVLRADYIAIAPILAIILLAGNRFTPRTWVALLLPISLGLGLFLLRRSLAYPAIVAYTPNGVPWNSIFSIDNFGPKVWAILGRYDLLGPDYQHRYHWWGIHVLFVICTAHYFFRYRNDRILLFVLACWVWFVITRLLSPAIGIYGHRHSLVLVLLEMLFVARIVTRHWNSLASTDFGQTPTEGRPLSALGGSILMRKHRRTDPVTPLLLRAHEREGFQWIDQRREIAVHLVPARPPSTPCLIR